MDEYHRLLSLQETYEKEADTQTGLHLVGLSVNETISELIKKGLAKKADRVRGDFKVPDRRSVDLPTFSGVTAPCLRLDSPLHRFYFIKLQALTSVKDWPSLEAFAKLRKSPIGYEPFVTHLVDKGHPKEAAKYVPRCEQKHRVVSLLPSSGAEFMSVAEAGFRRLAGAVCQVRGVEQGCCRVQGAERQAGTRVRRFSRRDRGLAHLTD